LQDPSEANEVNLSDVRREASRNFRKKKRECLKDEINELESNSKNKNIRDLCRADLLANLHKILNRWKNYFCQLLNVHGAGGVRQIEMHTADAFVPETSASEVEVAIGNLKSYK
jgi:hypothetical protein